MPVDLLSGDNLLIAAYTAAILPESPRFRPLVDNFLRSPQPYCQCASPEPFNVWTNSGFALGFSAETNIRPPRLEIFEVTARGDFPIVFRCLAAKLQDHRFWLREAHIACTQRQYTIRQLQQLQHLLCMCLSVFSSSS